MQKRMIHVLTALLILAMLVPPASVRAEYEPQSGIISSTQTNDWLYDAAKAGVEGGVKSVTEKLLSSIGKAILASYAPILADLFFGGNDNALEIHTQRILDRIEDLEQHISDDIATALDELMDQYEAGFKATVRSARDRTDVWLSDKDLFLRVQRLEEICETKNMFNDVRIALEEYILTEGESSDIQLRRLNLLPMHISAAQLAVTTGRYCEGSIAINAAYTSEYESSVQFDEWATALTAEDIAEIEAKSPRFDHFRDEIYDQILHFYNQIAEAGYIQAYVDDNFTPPMFQMEQFTGNVSQHDIPEVVTNPGSWGVPDSDCTPIPFIKNCHPGPLTLLDGLRWYYYVDIPGSECLDGYAFRALIDTGYLPMVEVEGKPAASACNRFWFLDPYLNSSGWPNTYIASFDGFDLWFEDPEVAYELHKQMVLGDMVRLIYGPASLVLDRIYKERTGQSVRPLNAWDNVLNEYDRRVGLLNVSTSYTDAITYEEVIAKEGQMGSCGLTIESVGLNQWFGLLKGYVINQLDNADCANDIDGDTILDTQDNCPVIANTDQANTDGDIVGDVCDDDDDGDGVEDSSDAFPRDPTETIDTDQDGIGNVADTDDDNDGVEDASDAFQLDSAEALDTDQDGIGNNADTDDDNDGIPDTLESESLDTDGDGVPNALDIDADGDNVLDEIEAGINPSNPLDSNFDSTPDFLDTNFVAIRGLMWNDLNANGKQDREDTPISSIPVVLFTIQESVSSSALEMPFGVEIPPGYVLIDTALTDEDGRYLFTGLQPGKYVAMAEGPENLAITQVDQMPDRLDSDMYREELSQIVQTQIITVGVGSDIQDDWDAGFSLAASVNVTIFGDVNGDGIHDMDESSIDNAIVVLLDDKDAEIVTLTSAINGIYRFSHMTPGSYSLLMQISQGEMIQTTSVDLGALAPGEVYEYIQPIQVPQNLDETEDEPVMEDPTKRFFLPTILQ